MPFDHQERRTCVQLASIIDDALDLAQHCGWRYAIAFLISEKIPSPIIQRLLSSGGQIRRPASLHSPSSPDWKGTESDDMQSLFAWLRERRMEEASPPKDVPCASRSSARPVEID